MSLPPSLSQTRPLQLVMEPKDVVERLEAVLAELERLRLPSGMDGSSLLDVLEAMEQERQTMRTRAKALLSHSPAALPGWRLGGVIGNDGVKKPPGTIMTVRRHQREAGLRLIQRRQAAAPRGERR
jgi:hypothetical protein